MIRRAPAIARVAVLAAGACLILNPGSGRQARPPAPGAPAASRRELAPRPTESRPGRDDEAKNRELREIWIEQMHRAAPGTDWRAIERSNHRSAIQARRTGSPPAGSGSWVELGSANLAGRTFVTAMASGRSELYVGTASGGIWSGHALANDWRPRAENLGYGVHHFAIVPGPPESWVAATEDGSIHTSTNGGVDWAKPTGLPDAISQVVRLLRDASAPRRVYLLIEGWRWVGSWDHRYHLYRSEDGGMSFSWLQSEPLSARPDIWIDRVHGGPLYLLVDGTLRRSTDGGVSFVTAGAAASGAAVSMLAGSEAGAPTLYGLLRVGDAWQLHRSLDGGATWSYRGGVSDVWEGSLCASIHNPDLLLIGGVNCQRTVDGGATFTPINEWYDYYGSEATRLHADVPGIDCLPDGAGGEVFYINTDGGTYRLVDGGRTVQNLSLGGLRISQYYSILTSDDDPYLVAAGSQDQGYQVSQPAFGTPLMHFVQTMSGDYGHLTSASGTLNMLYAVYPGFILLQVNEMGPPDFQFIDFPDTGHEWLPPILADPRDHDVVYFCADHLWKLERTTGFSYSATELPQDFASSDGETVTALAISPADYRVWYAGTSAGRLWSSRDAGGSWTPSPDGGPAARYFRVTGLLPSPVDRDECLAGGSGYSGPAVYRTTNGGSGWAPMARGLPSTLVHGLAFNDPVHRELYAATEAGPYRYDEAAGTWSSLLGVGAPLTTYWDVEGVPALGVVRFATYGRGIWDYTPGPSGMVETQAAPAASPFRLRAYPNPASSQTTLNFALSQAGFVRIEVFDITGRLVAVPRDGPFRAGEAHVTYNLSGDDGRRLAAGIYLVRLLSPEGVAVEKLQVMR